MNFPLKLDQLLRYSYIYYAFIYDQFSHRMAILNRFILLFVLFIFIVVYIITIAFTRSLIGQLIITKNSIKLEFIITHIFTLLLQCNQHSHILTHYMVEYTDIFIIEFVKCCIARCFILLSFFFLLFFFIEIRVLYVFCCCCLLCSCL